MGRHVITLLKHENNTDVAFSPRVRIISTETGNEWWQGQWWNIVNTPFLIDGPEDAFMVTKEQVDEWKEIQTP